MTVDLNDAEWQQVMGILALAPWRDANPLLMRIGEQLRLASSGAPHDRPVTNSAGIGTLKQ